LNVIDPRLLEQLADALGTSPGLIEKDWYVVHALKALAALDLGTASLVFTGGTCLSKAWKLIQRFSEDVDFKAIVPENYGRAQRRALRKAITDALVAAGFGLIEETARDEGRFFILQLDYGSTFPVQIGLRPHIQIEVSLRRPKLSAITRPVSSFAAEARREAPEIAGILCADPIETAAEKLSALAWRVLSQRARSEGTGDPSMIRHLHDLAALESHVTDAPAFVGLTREVVALDVGRGDPNRPQEIAELLPAMLKELTSSPHWRSDYDTFIRSVSYAASDQSISFDDALAACTRLVARFP
jgi:predicted nucleotidyltransferase component of viral defense system